MSHDRTFCALPWNNLNTTPLGQCKLCCNITDFKVLYLPMPENSGRTKRALGWGRDHLNEIWNGVHMRRVRERMLEGQYIDDCQVCYDLEAAGSDSPRLFANRSHPHLAAAMLTPAVPELPTSLELRLSTRCNLRCVTCWSGSSTTVAEHRQQLLSDPMMPAWLRLEWDNDIGINIRGEQNFDSDPNYISTPISRDNFAALAHGLKRLYITGGEPTMDSTVYQYLDMLQEAGNNRCHVSFTTNCTLWNPKLMDRISAFQENEVQISIDGYGTINEWIRRPSKWQVVSEIFKRYLKDTSVREIKVFTVVSAMNVLELAPLLSWLGEMAKSHDRQVTWYPIMLSNPHWLSVSSLPTDRLQVAADELMDLDHIIHCGNLDAKGGLNHVTSVLRNSQYDSKAAYKLHDWLEYEVIDVGPWKSVLSRLTEVI